MEKLLAELRHLLTLELGLENELRELKERKESVLTKMDKHIKGNSFSNDFVRIQREFKVIAVTEEGLKRFGEQPPLKISKQKIKEAIDDGVDVAEYVALQYKLITYKKKNGLDELSQDVSEA